MKSAIKHTSHSNYAFPIDEDKLKLRIEAAKDDLKNVRVIYGPRYVFDDSEPYQQKKMELKASDQYTDYFVTTITLDDPRFRYHFLLDDGQEKYWFNEKGFFKNRPRGYESGFFQYSAITPDDLIDKPDWLDDAVVYQIFPERFKNSNPDLDPDDKDIWGKIPKRDSFYGGDLQGIIDKLDYIENLGVNTIYLTPIFKSPTNHKYNIDDYMKVDPHFGDIELAKELISKCHKRNIRVILDGVFNHSGYDFFAFKDLREKGKNSDYKDWFLYDSLPLKTEPPVNYQTFARNIPTLPKLNTANQEVQDYLLKVVRFWMEELNIDGWRLDVADEVDSSFWRRFRKTVKQINPEAYILGEVWHSGLKWLQGNQFDGTMNYTFATAVTEFFGKKTIGPTEFHGRLIRNMMNYKSQIYKSMLNLIDSHDTPRLLHYCQDNKEAMKLSVLFQMTYLGIPMILYGDELGLTGGEEPDSRRCMPWSRLEELKKSDLFNHYQKLIKIRKELSPLRNGSFQSLYVDEARNIYGFSRINDDKRVEVLINNSPVSRQVRLVGDKINKKVLNDKITGKTHNLTNNSFVLNLKPYQGKIMI